MKEQLPELIRNAIELKKELFRGEDGTEWKIEITSDAGFVEKVFGSPVLVFANNGYGDYLFLKKTHAGNCEENVFVFLHAPPEIQKWKEDLGFLLELQAREPSQDSYPRAIYESGELVFLGDRVRFKYGLFFWKGWIEGVVEYVPGISPRNPKHENNELKWASIKGDQLILGPLVNPKTGIIRKVQLVARKQSLRQNVIPFMEMGFVYQFNAKADPSEIMEVLETVNTSYKRTILSLGNTEVKTREKNTGLRGMYEVMLEDLLPLKEAWEMLATLVSLSSGESIASITTERNPFKQSLNPKIRINKSEFHTYKISQLPAGRSHILIQESVQGKQETVPS